MRRKCTSLIMSVAIALVLGLWAQPAQAHTVRICWEDVGAVTTFYAGTYHGASEGPSPIGGIIVDGFEFPFSGFITAGALPSTASCASFIPPGFGTPPAVNHYQTFTSGFAAGSHTISFTATNVVQAPWGAFPALTFGGGACADADFDGICNDDDACPLDFNNDADGDGVCGNVDTCPNDPNPNQADTSACLGDICGNGIVTGSEQCDDGNIAGGDGCSALCTTEVSNVPPTAACQDVSVSADAACQGTATANDVDNGSTDTAPGTIASLALSPAAPYELDDTDVTLTVTDDESATASCSATVTVIDDTDPTVTAPAGVTVNTDSGVCSASGVTLGAATAGDNCAVSVTDDAPATYPLGNTTVTFTATDGSTNSADATDTATVTVNDNENPSITAPPAVTGAECTSPAGANVSLGSAAASDACGVVSVTSNHSSTLYPIATTPVTFTATDGSGNTASAGTSVTVVDTTKPNFTAVAAAQTLECTSTSGATASYGASAADVCSASVGVAAAPASGSTFALGGPHTVTFTATDAQGLTKTATTSVKVVDTTKPIFTAVAAAQTLECATPSGTAATYAATAADACSASVGVVAAPASGTIFGLGTSSVLFTATDAQGLTNTAGTSVTVQDTTLPAISNVTAAQTLECTSPAGTPASYSASASDACSASVDLVASPVSGSLFGLGTSSVLFSATDAQGLISTAGTSVTVNDTTAPVITGLTASPAVLWPPNHKMVSVSVSATTADACDASVVCSVTGATSDEPDNATGVGDGNTTGDIGAASGLSIGLRAERQGTGDGRVYTIGVICTDASGNSTPGSTTVTVPHSQGNGGGGAPQTASAKGGKKK